MAMNEETALLKKYGPFNGKRVLEVGSANAHSNEIRKAAEGAAYFGLDQQAHAHVQIVHDLTQPLTGVDAFDVVCVFSVLEHTPEPWLVAKHAEALCKAGGLMLVSAPFQWRVHNHPDDYFRFCPSGLRSLFKNCDLVEEGHWPEKAVLTTHQNGKVQLYWVGRKHD